MRSIPGAIVSLQLRHTRWPEHVERRAIRSYLIYNLVNKSARSVVHSPNISLRLLFVEEMLCKREVTHIVQEVQILMDQDEWL